MKKWETALTKFIADWKDRKDVIGAVVCGSFITGNTSKHSDIDIQIILDSNTAWRERGNEIIDGILIEYFANPVKKHYEYFESDYKSRRKNNAHMFVTGKMLFDNTGELGELIKSAKKYLVKKYPKMNKIQVELAKYHLWDTLDNLEEVSEAGGEDFYFVYFNCLYDLFDTYAKFLRFDSLPVNKFRRFLTDEKDKKKYCVGDFPDQEFVKMTVSVLELKDKPKMMKEYKAMTGHVLDKMGGFNIDGWKIKSPASDIKKETVR